MKNLILCIIFCITSTITFAQDTLYKKLPTARSNVPLYLVNSNIIAGLNNLNPNLIQSINVYKSEKVPANLKNLRQYGIVVVETKQQLKIKTFKEIKNWLNIEGKVSFAVDGFFVDDETLLIATDGIMEINIIREHNNDIPTIINIWTLKPNERYMPSVHYSTKPLDPLLNPARSPNDVIIIR